MSEYKYQIHRDPKAYQEYARIQDFSLISGGADWSDNILTPTSQLPGKHNPPCQHTENNQSTKVV